MSVISKNKGTSLRSFVLNSGLRKFQKSTEEEKKKKERLQWEGFAEKEGFTLSLD